MVAEGVAQPLQFQEDPIEKFLQSKGQRVLRPRSDVYGTFDGLGMKRAILGD